jgi:phenylpropionate dioxygenase-like ring-hydroxylating dioxygenase large terminal subunit
MAVTNFALALSAADVERTCLPLEQATMLPGAAYTDHEVLEWEQAHVFGRGWVCAGHLQQVGARGRFLTVEVAGENILVIGDDDGVPRAFLNTCRHRGARLVVAPEGTARRIQCSYHAWTYGLDGALRNAPFTEGLQDFDARCFALHEVRLAVVEGLVLLDLSGQAPPPQAHIGDLAPLLARYRTAGLERGARIVYDVDANWKTIGENYSECLHCPGVHPELNRLSHYLSGVAIGGAGEWCGGSMTLAPGVETMATDGGGLRAPIDGVDRRSILYFLIFPNTLVSLHPDYVMLHTLWPKAPDRTQVVCEWYFEPETMAAPGFDPADAVGFWDQVNREDWEVCALTQRGMTSRSFVPGRYTTQEGDVHAFDQMIARRYLEALR